MEAAPHSHEHWARVKAEVAQLLDEVPLYAAHRAPPPPDGTNGESIAAWLAGIPAIAKRDLRRGFPKSLVRRSQNLRAALESGEVELIATSGTTEERLQVIWQQHWWDSQEREAIRLNARVAAVVERAYKEAVLTTPVCGGATCHIGRLPMSERTIDGMLFLNQIADPTHWNEAELDRMLEEWQSFSPTGVEADPAYLAALSRHAARRGVTLRTGYVNLTYELVTRAHRRAMARAIDAPVFNLYGATEAGVLFMECDRGRLHHNASHSHVELVPVGPRLARVYVTTLGRAWMPLLRYDSGDLVRLLPDDAGPCPCGRPGLAIDRVEGRAGDALEGPSGLVSACALDDAVDSEGLEAWQLTHGPSGAELRFLGTEAAGDHAAAAAEKLLGRPVRPRAEAIAPEGSGKYRLVKAVEW